MLHIILLVLKIIGWILLAILGLLVLLVCVTLFTPLKYRGDASCKGTLDSLYGRMRFSWLAHLVSGYAVYENGELDWTIRIAWKKIKAEEEVPLTEEEDFPYRKEQAPQQEKPAKQAQRQEKQAEQPEQPEQLKQLKQLKQISAGESTADESEKDARLLEKLMKEEEQAGEAPGEGSTETVPGEEKAGSNLDGENTAGAGKPEEKEGVSEKAGKLYEKFHQKGKEIYDKIKYTFHKICDTIKSLLEKKDKLAVFIADEAHQSAFFALLIEVKRLLRFLKPKKLCAEVHFGFEDPSVTGKVLALISMAYPFIGEHADIEPDFEQRVLEGNLLIAGKVRMLYAAVMLWNLVWNKNVRTTLRHIRKFEL